MQEKKHKFRFELSGLDANQTLLLNYFRGCQIEVEEKIGTLTVMSDRDLYYESIRNHIKQNLPNIRVEVIKIQKEN